MNNQEAFPLYTMLNMQNSQLPCFIPSISLKPFPHLAHSICHLSTLRSYSSVSCFVMLPVFSFFLRHPLQFYVVFLPFLPRLYPLVLYNLIVIPISVFFPPSEPSLSLSLSPLSVSPCSVKAVPATLCSQYPLI